MGYEHVMVRHFLKNFTDGTRAAQAKVRWGEAWWTKMAQLLVDAEWLMISSSSAGGYLSIIMERGKPVQFIEENHQQVLRAAVMSYANTLSIVTPVLAKKASQSGSCAYI